MNGRNTLLVELLVEELPPKSLAALGTSFASGIAESLRAQGLASADAVVVPYATPRRLAVSIDPVTPRGADRAVSVKLMPASVGLTANGEATPALLKKLAAVGADASVLPDLQRRADGKAESLFLDTVAPGAALGDGLQRALDATLAALPIAKVMQYQLADGWTSVSFVRPAHGLVALHGADVVPVRVLGLDAGRVTHGHRFEGSREPIVLADASRYAEQLEGEGAVLASFDSRRDEIARQLAAAAASCGLRGVDDADLLDEVTALVERPNVIVCAFDAAFLAVPSECLILTMKANQKYFPLVDAAGALTERFLVVANVTPADPSAVVEGNERVVRPRLADAKFFFDQDRKRTLQSRRGELGRVAYFERLGSLDNRVERIRSIARDVGELVGGRPLATKADAAASLAKADLLTDMVGEFPELQGTMGRYYALHDGVAADVAEAIADQYKPRFSGDSLPTNDVGLVLAIADKLESIVGMFVVGKSPTGDRDPFGLRRSAFGIVRMLVERRLPLTLNELLQLCVVPFSEAKDSVEAMATLRQDMDVRGAQSWAKLTLGVTIDDETIDRVAAFVRDRLESYLLERGYAAREIASVLDVERDRWDRVVPKLAAVRSFLQLPEAPSLAAANKRVGNILKKAEDRFEPSIGDAVLIEPSERRLIATIRELEPAAEKAAAEGDYVAALRTWAGAQAPVDAFFASVMVSVPDASLRTARLSLLCKLHGAMNRVANLSLLAA